MVNMPVEVESRLKGVDEPPESSNSLVCPVFAFMHTMGGSVADEDVQISIESDLVVE